MSNNLGGNKFVRSEFYEKLNIYFFSTNNNIIENIFDIAISERLFNVKIIELCERVLSRRFTYLTKVTALDYIAILHKKIDKNTFIRLNQIHFKSQNDILKFQSIINLMIYDYYLYEKSIGKMLNKTDYPTLFYRLRNNLENFRKSKKSQLNIILLNSLKDKKFSDDVKNDFFRNI